MNLIAAMDVLNKNMKTVKTIVAIIIVCASIISAYIAVDDYLWTRDNALDHMQKQFITHERIRLQNKLDNHSTQSKIISLELAIMDTHLHLTEPQKREVESLKALLAFHLEGRRKSMERLALPDDRFVKGYSDK